MSVTLGQGFMPYLLNHIKSIVGLPATPQYKLELTGFTNLLLNQDRPEVLRLNNVAGHQETVQIRYKQRYLMAHTFTDEADVCSNALIEPRKETSVSLSSFRAIPLYLEDETVARYENDASKTIMQGLPATAFMNEMMEEIYRATSALLQGVNNDLLTTLSTKIGKNRVTGNNASKTINLDKDGTKNLLTEGMTEVDSDFMINLMSGKNQMVGSGLLNNYFLQQYAKSYNQAGINTAIEAGNRDWYYDQQAATILGANQFLSIEKNAVQMVEYLQYTGFKAGIKPGGSTFGILPLPIFMGQNVKPVMFDFQLKYYDCPTVLTDGYYGTSITVQKGWNLILSKKSGLFTIPSDAYRAGDAMAGNNGVLRYTATNTCTTC